jgi:hypothetical protein
MVKDMDAEQKFGLMLTAMIGEEAIELYQWHKVVEWQCANAPEPEPVYDVMVLPEDWDEEDTAHYDTPGGW